MVDVELESTPDAPASARRALDPFSQALSNGRMRDVRLLVSELVTNAVRHAGLRTEDRIRLFARLQDAVLRVEVQDSGSGFEPRAPVPDPSRASGWGLYLVDELADRWGMQAEAGTLIWFELDSAPL
jgi:anti-sigma regulatory factor (Ser/Thr protein kinase)